MVKSIHTDTAPPRKGAGRIPRHVTRSAFEAEQRIEPPRVETEPRQRRHYVEQFQRPVTTEDTRTATIPVAILQAQLDTVRAVIAVLHSPRNRFGKIQTTSEAYSQLDALLSPEVRAKIPHGGLDGPDKAQMILSVVFGLPVASILKPLNSSFATTKKD